MKRVEILVNDTLYNQYLQRNTEEEEGPKACQHDFRHHMDVAHAVGGQLRVPHGEANAVLIPILMEQYPKHYLNNATVLADAFGVNTAGMTGEEMVTAAAQKVKELQQKCGVKPKFTQNIDEETRELMYWAVKFDPAGLFYPLPDEVIRGCIADAYE
jgi:alcohol dehydrogenase class IV